MNSIHLVALLVKLFSGMVSAAVQLMIRVIFCVGSPTNLLAIDWLFAFVATLSVTVRELLAVALCSPSSRRVVVSAGLSLTQVRERGWWMERPLCELVVADGGRGLPRGVAVKAGGG